MKRHFNTHTEGIDLDFWHDFIKSRGRLVTLNKGDFVCRRGEPTDVVGFLVSGYLKYTIIGSNRIGGFTFANALFGDYPNCMHRLPAQFDIVAGRKSEVWMMDATVLPELYENDAEINKQGHLFAEAAYNSLVNRYCSFLSDTVLNRYINLVSKYPQLEQDIPQREIAEYLQISPIYLCRLRRQVNSRFIKQSL